MEHKEDFQFTYCAAQHREVENIRKNYLPREENKLEQLRRLHQVPTQKAQTAALIVGVMGALIMGTGMSFVMTDLGAAWGNLAMVLGIVIGVVGMVLVALAYPVYNRVLKNQREKIAPEILKLSDELLSWENTKNIEST